MKLRNRTGFFVNVTIKGICRSIFWMLLLVSIWLGALFINYTFGAEIESVKIIDIISDHYLVVIALSFASLLVDHVNRLAPDRINKDIMRYLAHKSGIFHLPFMLDFGSASFFSIDELDEIVHHIYGTANGRIILFNPSAELVVSQERPWTDIRDAIRKNRENIERIILRVTEETSKAIGGADEIARMLELPAEKVAVHMLEGSDVSVAASIRTAIYSRRAAKGSNVEMFLFRPIAAPYNDRFVLVQDENSLSKARYQREHGARNLLSKVEELLEQQSAELNTD